MTWLKADVQGKEVCPRYAHCAGIMGQKMVVFGGVNFKSYANADVNFLELDQSMANKLYKDDVKK